MSGPGVPRFEGSYLGDKSRLSPEQKLECKICWWVYDPALGDPEGEIAPGTAFAALPGHWRCPACDGDADQFLVMP
ncbi:MAG: hypothetical protein RL385_877 [Pseudomonadota bacterium]|jgi:rubredoxin